MFLNIIDQTINTNLLQGQGRIEKTEIIEMAIKHIKHLRTLVPESLRDEIPVVAPSPVKAEKNEIGIERKPHSSCVCNEKFYMGYKEAVDEVNPFVSKRKNLLFQNVKTLCFKK